MDTPADPSSRLARIEARLTELEDREAIRELIARYGPLADAGQADAVAALWAEDGSYAVDGYGENRGRLAVAALIDAPTHQRLMQQGCAHVLSPVRVDVCGSRAVAVGYSCVFRRHDTAFEAWRVSANRWELEKRDGTWQVLRRVNRLLDGNAAAAALLGAAADAPPPPG
jgi:uncharacterized protein (TIGR02246 family)